MNALILILLITIFTLQSESARILCVFLIPSISHQIVFHPIYRELSLRGHEVTVITPNPIGDATLSNLTEIDTGHLYKTVWEALSRRFTSKMNHWDWFDEQKNIPFLEEVLKTEGVRKLLNDSSREFDLVIAESLFPGMAAFSGRYKCPYVGIVSLDALPEMHRYIGNPTHPTLYPSFMTEYQAPMSFYQRVDSFLFDLMMMFKSTYDYIPFYDAMVRKYISKDLPYLGDLERNISLLFVNTNPILHKSRALTHGVIELGQMHLKPKKPLPKDLKNFLDASTEGVVYFSLGSNVKSIFLDSHKRQEIVEVFTELPYKILWKFENETMDFKPKNVEIRKWLPQQDLLGHENLKVFVTQGGLQSLEEAILNELPLVALPFIGDQPANAKRIEELGIGKKLDFATMTKEEFKNAILEVSKNSTYKENIRKIRGLLFDKPMTGLEKAVWWTEYVIRHKGTPFFRSPWAEASWFEFLMVDVISVLLLVATATIYLSYFLIKYIYILLFQNKLKEKLQ